MKCLLSPRTKTGQMVVSIQWKVYLVLRIISQRIGQNTWRWFQFEDIWLYFMKKSIMGDISPFESMLFTPFPYSDLIRLECLRHWSVEKCSVVCGEHLSLFGKFFLKQNFRKMPSIFKNKNRSDGGIHTMESLPCFKNNF